MQEKKIIFNEKRALDVFKILDSAWKNRIGIFKDIVLPQDLWVPNGWNLFTNTEKANFFFFAALPMRGGLVSEDPFKWVCALRNNYPDLFNPKIVAEKISPAEISNLFEEITTKILTNGSIGKLGAGSLSYNMNEHANHWHENAITLNSYWGADILNVFWGVPEFEEAFRRIDYKRTKVGFMGMRRKIFSLLTIFLQEKGLIPVFPTPIPVDFHAMRILWQTDILNMQSWITEFVPRKKYPKELSGYMAVRIYEAVPNQIAIWSQKFLQKISISHMIINPALWVLSRTLCAEHLQTSSQKNGQQFFTAEKLKANSNLWPKNYKNPCDFCPIENFCTWCISSNPYYRDGWLVRIEKVFCPYRRLQGIDWVSYGPTHKIRKNKNRGAESS